MDNITSHVTKNLRFSAWAPKRSSRQRHPREDPRCSNLTKYFIWPVKQMTQAAILAFHVAFPAEQALPELHCVICYWELLVSDIPPTHGSVVIHECSDSQLSCWVALFVCYNSTGLCEGTSRESGTVSSNGFRARIDMYISVRNRVMDWLTCVI